MGDSWKEDNAPKDDPFAMPAGTAGRLAFMSHNTFDQLWENDRTFALVPKNVEVQPPVRGEVILFLESSVSWEGHPEKEPTMQESLASATGRAMRTRVAGVVENIAGLLPDWLAVSFDAIENIEGTVLHDSLEGNGALLLSALHREAPKKVMP